MTGEERRQHIIRTARIDQTEGVLILGEDKIDLAMLSVMLTPENRVLWSFIRKGGRVQGIPYDEAQVLWLEASDLRHADECGDDSTGAK